MDDKLPVADDLRYYHQNQPSNLTTSNSFDNAKPRHLFQNDNSNLVDINLPDINLANNTNKIFETCQKPIQQTEYNPVTNWTSQINDWENDNTTKGKAIGVVGASGGIGSTIFSICLGLYLAKNYKTVLMDAITGGCGLDIT
ncbi:MAG: hypothetical protein LBT99_02020, partial [Bifidobacteriaceae bacterium]|nr:hypothetical protein [Bifidobacteriaceae bacterium]